MATSQGNLQDMKKLLRSLIRKVHPDLYQTADQAREINANGLKVRTPAQRRADLAAVAGVRWPGKERRGEGKGGAPRGGEWGEEREGGPGRLPRRRGWQRSGLRTLDE
jgi:hypothetical protein